MVSGVAYIDYKYHIALSSEDYRITELYLERPRTWAGEMCTSHIVSFMLRDLVHLSNDTLSPLREGISLVHLHIQYFARVWLGEYSLMHEWKNIYTHTYIHT